MSIKIVTLNTRGMGDLNKRRSIFNFYRSRANIICLQECHSYPEIENSWINEWRGEILFSHGNSKARGVCILLPKGIKPDPKKIIRDQSGRYIMFEINWHGKDITICNVYAPNEDKPHFFVNLFKDIVTLSENIIITGDFNLVLDTDMDRLGSTHNKKNAVQILSSAMEELNLVDIYRIRNPDKKRYSWFRRMPQLQASRIDFTLLSAGLADMCENIMYFTGVMSDHSALLTVINLTGNERGNGYWKLNTMHLRNTEYINMINEYLKKIKVANQKLDIIKQWEILKKDVKEESMRFSKNLASEKSLIIAQLSEKATEIEEKIQLVNDNGLAKLLFDTQSELDELIAEKTNSAIFRTKSTYYELGEKTNKYFYNLEKTRYNAKTIHVLLDEKGNEIRKEDEILKSQKTFYEKLFSKNKEVKFNLKNDTDIKLTAQIKQQQGVEITDEEILDAVKQLKNCRTPGSDGIPIDFYKVFWNQIKDTFCAVVRETYCRGHLHKTALFGIINLIPKANRDSRILKNLRPISLLNTDFKIMEKIIANRIEPALDHIINMDQKGFMKNRRISCNIRRIFEIIKFADETEIEALILSIDFMKCFDMIEISALIGAMKYYDFHETIINWTEIFYRDFVAVIQNNGHFSEKIRISRGVHQGAPCSSYYFLICAELLATIFRTDQRIAGIPVKDIMNTLGQYADDADLYSLYQQESINAIFSNLKTFYQNFGFKVNYDKTSLMRIGSLKNSDAKLITEKEVVWTNEPVNILGIYAGTDTNKCMSLNYDPLIEKAKTTLKMWKNRHLSLLGKINIINTLVVSLFVYRMTVLPEIDPERKKQLDNIFNEFLWNGAKPKISLKILQANKKNGGQKLVDLTLKSKALKIGWIQSLLTDDKLQKLVYENIGLDLGDKIWSCNLKDEDIKTIIKDPFWVEVVIAWQTFKKIIKSESKEHTDEIIWCNSDVKIADKVLYRADCIKNGLIYVSQLYDKDIKLKSALQLCNEYGMDLMYLNGIISALPRRLKSESLKQPCWDEEFYNNMKKKKFLTSYAYNTLIQQKDVTSAKRTKWEAELETSVPVEEFLEYFQDVFRISNVPKYRSFQYRLLHRAVITNVLLSRWKIISNENCTFCGKDAETYSHLFVMCEKIQDLWISLENFMYIFTKDDIDFNVKNVMFNRIVNKSRSVKNFLCLVCKQYIYRQRCFKVSVKFHELKELILKLHNMEKYIATKNNKLTIFYKKWYDKVPEDLVNREPYESEYNERKL